MTTTTLNNYAAESMWRKSFLFDNVTGSGYKKYMGLDGESIITLLEDLTKAAGETVITTLAGQLRGAGVTGNATLRGSEEALNTSVDKITVSLFRHGVSFTKDQKFRSALDMPAAGRQRLADYFGKRLKNNISTQFGATIVTQPADGAGNTYDVCIPYASSTTGNKNAHLVANNDRIMLGNNSAAYKTTAAGVWATALLQLDATTDKISAATLHNAKAMALATGNTSGLGITPITNNDDSGQDTFVFFCGPEQYSDLCADDEVKYNYQHAADLAMKNPLFMGGDRWLDGILIRRIDNLATLGAVGKSSAVVTRGFLAGKQAITQVYAQTPTPKVDSYDFDFVNSIAIEEIAATKKTSFNGQAYGVLEVVSTTTPKTF